MTTVHPMEADTQITRESENDGVADRARKSIQDARHRASETAHDLRERADQTAHDLRDRAEFEYELGKERLGNVSSEAERMVRRNPVLAIAGAVGVGVLVGLAMGNRRR
ncbi:hypothetical protein ACN2XU_18475 [Primorskyibacter sp. 2E107]|uniref:hypothetical protein n=1 Tax=Primorskyibacter sp. 2E107 TaxID=3403458 RepID=UPI003AF5D127